MRGCKESTWGSTYRKIYVVPSGLNILICFWSALQEGSRLPKVCCIQGIAEYELVLHKKLANNFSFSIGVRGNVKKCRMTLSSLLAHCLLLPSTTLHTPTKTTIINVFVYLRYLFAKSKLYDTVVLNYLNYWKLTVTTTIGNSWHDTNSFQVILSSYNHKQL